MEEILASIRRIISDEDGAARPAPPKLSVVDSQPREAVDPMTAQQSVSLPAAPPPEPADAEDGVFQLSEAQAAPVDDDEDDVSFAEPTPPPPPRMAAAEPPRPAPAPEPPPRMAAEEAGRHLLSQRSDDAVHTAFNQLAATFLSNQARTLEDLVKEMMRPMLKTWLDDNLPPLVERLVRDEIERVSRGRR